MPLTLDARSTLHRLWEDNSRQPAARVVEPMQFGATGAVAVRSYPSADHRSGGGTGGVSVLTHCDGGKGQACHVSSDNDSSRGAVGERAAVAPLSMPPSSPRQVNDCQPAELGDL